MIQWGKGHEACGMRGPLAHTSVAGVACSPQLLASWTVYTKPLSLPLMEHLQPWEIGRMTCVQMCKNESSVYNGPPFILYMVPTPILLLKESKQLVKFLTALVGAQKPQINPSCLHGTLIKVKKVPKYTLLSTGYCTGPNRDKWYSDWGNRTGSESPKQKLKNWNKEIKLRR